MVAPDFNKFPLVIQKMLLPYLQSQDLSQGAHVSKLFQKIMNDNAVWIKVAKEYNITLKDPKNAKKELQDIFQQINVIALSCLKEQDKFSSIKDPFVLNHELEEHYKKDVAAHKTFREMNTRILDLANGNRSARKQFLVNPDVFKAHRQICQYIQSHAQSLQSQGINLLESLQYFAEPTGQPWEPGINAGIVLIQNGMVGNNPTLSNRSNVEYWSHAFKRIFGLNIGYKTHISEPLLQAVLNQFKKAEFSDEEKKVVLNEVYKCYIDCFPILHKNAIEKLLKFAEPDEETLVAAMVTKVAMGELFVDHSSFSKEKLLTLVDVAEKKALEELREILSLGEKQTVEKFKSLREYITHSKK